MALWLGLMKIAEEAGLVKLIGNALKPNEVFIPRGSKRPPCYGIYGYDIAANILGLGNAATLLGIKAMQELQELNEEKIQHQMPMYVFSNKYFISNIIASSVVAYRLAAGSKTCRNNCNNISCTIASTLAAVVAVKVFEKFSNKNKSSS